MHVQESHFTQGDGPFKTSLQKRTRYTLISSLRRSNIHTCSKPHNEIQTLYPGVTRCPSSPITLVLLSYGSAYILCLRETLCDEYIECQESQFVTVLENPCRIFGFALESTGRVTKSRDRVISSRGENLRLQRSILLTVKKLRRVFAIFFICNVFQRRYFEVHFVLLIC